MNPFESHIGSKIETGESENDIDALIEEFPAELHERLEQEVEHMEDKEAVDHLVRKLVARKESLVRWSVDEISKYVEIRHDVPLAVVESIQKSSEGGEDNLLGSGMNGRVYQSVRRAFACYKVLYLDRARENNLSIVQEAVMQYEMGAVAKKVPNGAHIPEVLGFVERTDMLAIMMQKVEGNSLIEIIEGKAELPENFDIDSFFSRLEATIQQLNEDGYFHRDLVRQVNRTELTPNSGNVMVDKDGNPWLVDFGSAIRALKPEGDAQLYQLQPEGRLWRATDLSGIHEMKERVAAIMRQKEQK